MTVFLIGLVIFFAVHLVPAVPPIRARWAARAGEASYRKQFSLIAGLGLALIVAGYIVAPRGAQWFEPWPGARAIAPLAMVVAFILLAASHMKTHLRARLRHPMLLGVLIWAAVHLAANGDARSTLLFGAFLAYSLIDLASAARRHAVKPFTPQAKYDAMAVVGGALLAALVMLFHRVLFGAPAVPWSL